MIKGKKSSASYFVFSVLSLALAHGVALGQAAPAPAQTQGAVAAQSQPAGPKLDRLKLQIERLIAHEDGVVGVAVKHLESGLGLAVNGDLTFPMASTFKLPVLVELLFQAKEGRFSLDDEISVQPSDQHIGSGLLAKLTAPGVKLSVRNMAQFMMLISDNSAADILLEKVGAANVNARLKGLGVEGISVNRSCQKLIADVQAVYQNVKTPEEARAAIIKFSDDPQDQATPLAMNSLLEKVFKKEIIDAPSCDLMVEIMLKCETGGKRILGDLPPDTKLAHKTGTIAGTVNDCGIIFLPDGAGSVALTVFTKDFTEDTGDIEAIIAKIARFVYDGFYFTM
jgi:beta-lactamase class A